MEQINLCIVEDEPVVRESLVKYLEEHPAIEIKLVANSMEDFIKQYDQAINPDINLIILDIGLPGINGVEGIMHIRERLPLVDIVMFTTYEEDEMIFDALCAGACSYISKRTSLMKIQEALFIITRGGSYMSPSIARKIAIHFRPKLKVEKAILTSRQNEIVAALVDGLSYKMIADKLYISIDTVRDHIKKIYRTLEVNSKAEVIKKSLDGKI